MTLASVGALVSSCVFILLACYQPAYVAAWGLLLGLPCWCSARAAACGLVDPWLNAPKCRCTSTAMRPARAAVAVLGTDSVWPLLDSRWPMPWVMSGAGGAP